MKRSLKDEDDSSWRNRSGRQDSPAYRVGEVAADPLVGEFYQFVSLSLSSVVFFRKGKSVPCPFSHKYIILIFDNSTHQENVPVAAFGAHTVGSPHKAENDVDDSEEDGSDSAAASDAAVVGRSASSPRSEPSKVKHRKRVRTSPVLVQVAQELKDLSGLTFPQPENFPQKLMSILQSGVAFDSIWWVGNGEAVAFHPRNLTETGILQAHFQISDYGTAVKHLTRW